MKKKLSICYHGTSKSAAYAILQKGFASGTYFARHLEDALGYGGNYVFEVCFEANKLPKGDDAWQFTVRRKVPPSKIVRLRYHPARKLLKENQALSKKILQSNLE